MGITVFKVMGSKVKVTETFASGGIQTDCSPLKIILTGSHSANSPPIMITFWVLQHSETLFSYWTARTC